MVPTMRRIAELVLRHRRLVIVGWVILIIAGGVSAGLANKRLKVDFSLPGQPGTDAANRIVQQFGNGGFTDPTLLSITAPAGQTISGHERDVAKAFNAAVASRPGLRMIDEANADSRLTDKGLFRTKDDRTAYALVSWPFVHEGKAAFLVPSAKFSKAAQAAAPAGWTVGATGEAELSQGDSKNTGPGVLLEALLGAGGALIVLAFVFASFLALLPLVVAAASIALSFLFLLPITYATNVSFIVQFLIALVGLGVAIDYSLLLVNRWREERDHGRDNHDAVIEAMEHAGRAVAFSGGTVAIGLLSMIILPVPFMRSIGYGGALIPLASVLTTLTLTPAILGGIGPKVDWPKIRHENVASKGWTSWARSVVKNRYVAAGLGVAALGALFLAFLGIKIGQADSTSLAHSGPSYTAWQQLKGGGLPAGALTPVQLLVKTDAAPEISQQLRTVRGIDHVVGSTTDGNVHDGNTVLFAIPHKETVNSTAVDTVRTIIKRYDGNPAVLGITGIGPAQIDFLHAVYGNFPYMLAFIAILTFVLLARGFRSVLLPLKAVILNLLTLSATLGFMVLFWQNGHGSQTLFNVAPTGAVTFWVPLMVFAFLFGLSMDYEVFILSRIREEYDTAKDTNEAVVEGIARTGRLVTSAALILFLAFLALATGPGTDLKLFATALGFGILLDATIVRSLLVPALVSMFGEWNWWMPKWLATTLRVRHASEPAVALAD
jgi:RND superfamily putative drug exporter